MHILAHRGLWTQPDEQNTRAAFERALRSGYGIELDVRDCNRQLVIAHDPPTFNTQSLLWGDFITLYESVCGQTQRFTIIAVNIKACGLAQALWNSIPAALRDYFFFFDMATPDALAYARLGARVFTRHSEVEPVPSYYPQSQGVWMDEFAQTWIDAKVMLTHLRAGKEVCLVSPELQKRPYQDEWAAWRETWKQWPAPDFNRVMLCTDFPDEAQRFFA